MKNKSQQKTFASERTAFFVNIVSGSEVAPVEFPAISLAGLSVIIITIMGAS